MFIIKLYNNVEYKNGESKIHCSVCCKISSVLLKKIKQISFKCKLYCQKGFYGKRLAETGSQ